jgi:hypothetical protein
MVPATLVVALSCVEESAVPTVIVLGVAQVIVGVALFTTSETVRVEAL